MKSISIQKRKKINYNKALKNNKIIAKFEHEKIM